MKVIHSKILLIIITLSVVYITCGYEQKTNPLRELGNAVFDLNGPDPVQLNEIISKVTEITINWTDPVNEDFDHVLVSWSPGGSTPVRVDKGIGNFTANVTNHDTTSYLVTIIAVDDSGNQSDAISITVNPTNSTIATGYTHFIYTADDLNAVRGSVPGYPTWSTFHNYYVMADIDLGSYPDWTAISTFSGMLDGNGYSISNLTITDNAAAPVKTEVGLVSSLMNTGILKNIIMDSSAVAGKTNVGVLVGRNYGTLVNCTVSNSSASGETRIGGLIGYNTSGKTISNSIVTNTVLSGTGDYIGGLIGWHQSTACTLQECHTRSVEIEGRMGLGGLVGYTTNAELIIDRCSATDLDLEADLLLGGGLVGYSLNTQLTVSKSFTDGIIESGAGYVGGLFGLVMNPGVSSFSDCYTVADVIGINYTGGLVGFIQTGATALNITNCYAAGVVTRPSGTNISFGFIGNDISPAVYTNCYFDKLPVPAAIGNNGFGTYVTTAELQSGTLPGLDAVAVWSINPAINSGYPFLRENPPVE